VDGFDHSGLGRRIEACRRLLMHARGRGWDITHVHPRSASHAARPVEGLEPLPSERLVYRTGVSAFSNRIFRQAIKASPEAELILVGFSLSSSCLATALTAHDWGLPVILAADAVLGGPSENPEVRETERSLRSIVAPFVRIAAADDLIEVRRTLRLVSSAVAYEG
jgi:nicotinamidase-related amidase